MSSTELLSRYHPEVLQLSRLSNPSIELHEFKDCDFLSSEKRLYYFYQTLNKIKTYASENAELHESIALHGRIISPDIVDSIKVTTEFLKVFKYSNALLNNANENPLHKLTTLNEIFRKILISGNLLGIFLEEPEVFILEMKEKYIKLNKLDMKEIQQLLNQRQEAKSMKNYELADALKLTLDQKGIIIQDSKFGSDWDVKELFDKQF